ncbi:M15 family metallopeptidase [Vagococcus elongatus]|uniref:D-alanyl-D-alanine carboxypeptidase-like core domain-containing protein n=1 Tax=Vagococcus elongatus TaxID=180344 RepID=A0A430AP76_9ENTE|nr:M15 family metallopeptidase [Vagococcus elongatus]RSU09687.1 hypothetical protein CBF29_10945 [Vagococcus elongatus]
MSKKILIVLSALASFFLFIHLKELKERQLDVPIFEKYSYSKGTAEEIEKETLPESDLSDYCLRLINSDHSFTDEDLTMPLKPLAEGYEVAEVVVAPYESMEKAANKAGITLKIISAYRSVSYQEQVYQDNLSENLNQGSTKKEAQKLTEDYVAKPGTSEHHTGLALDVLDVTWLDSGNGLVGEFGETEAGKWLDEHCAEFGFIIRYPKDKEDITKIQYEPWHLRYIGKEHAQYMKTHGLVLEEYIELLENEQHEKKESETSKSTSKETTKKS